MARLNRHVLITGSALTVGGLLGAVVQNAAVVLTLDARFVRSFLTGPPIAGLFAVVGAAIAYAAAAAAARMARRGAERHEWWNRAEWALNLARSDGNSDRVIGLRALEGLKDEATESEFTMIISVTEAVSGHEHLLDSDSPPADNGKRRWRGWPGTRNV